MRSDGPLILLTITTLSALLALIACSPSKKAHAEVQITHEIAPSPPVVGPAKVTLNVRNPAGEPISGATIKVEGNMSHAGMAPVFAVAQEVAPGRYQVSLDFTMSGDWVLLTDLTLPDGQKLQHQIDVRNVQPVHR